MASVEIRAVDHNDFDRWLPLWLGYQRFYEVEIPQSAGLKTWARFLDPVEPVHAALALVDGRALGLAQWIYHRSTWAIDDYCYLQDLFVSDDARGNGLGRALIELVAEEATRNGSPRLYWSTHESNRTAIQLYDGIAERSGFVIYRKPLV
ncbi:MAG: GNAT family N-acetyltransferase [Sphingomonas sp.]|jgi:hypothetical protein|uniref:GNAT family N-acetyltransferase n=1 Tax=Sphingomonas sp. TaxID=28214 RepID=UPI003567FC30